MKNRVRSALFSENGGKHEHEYFSSLIGCSRRTDAAGRLYLRLCAAVDLRRIGVGRCIWLHGCSFEFQKSETLKGEGG